MKKIKRLLSLTFAIIFAIIVVNTGTAFAQNEYTPGDVNRDGKVNISDVIVLRRYIVGGYGVSVNENASDVDASKEINMSDVILIRQYLAGGYGVTLLPSDDIHIHSLEAVARTEPTSTQDGNIAYWHCTTCGKYFSDADATTEIQLADTVIPATGSTDPSETYTVTFYDYDGTTVLATRTDIASGGYAQPPADPTKSGATFMGWSGTYANVTKNESVRAVFSDEKNVFVIESASGSVGDTVTVLVSIDGNVKFCGFDINLMYDSNLELVSYDDDLHLDLVTNAEAFDNGMKLNYSGVSDKTKARDIIELTFRIKNTSKPALPISITVNSAKEIVSNNPVDTTYSIVNGVVNVG